LLKIEVQWQLVKSFSKFFFTSEPKNFSKSEKSAQKLIRSVRGLVKESRPSWPSFLRSEGGKLFQQVSILTVVVDVVVDPAVLFSPLFSCLHSISQ
jgi:hypothetical protein